MDLENQVVEPSVQVVEPAVEVKTIEDVAKTQGWRPKEEYEGDPTKWVSAETFVAKGELIEKIETIGRELKEQKKANQALLEHHKKVKDSEFKRAVDYLKAQKADALRKGDAELVVDLDDQLANVRETQKLQAQEPVVASQPREFTDWVSNNKWYDTDDDLREEADIIGLTYAEKYKQQGIQKDPLEVLEYVSKQIKKLNPEKFTNPNRNKPSIVEGSAAPASRKTDTFELTEDERQVMNQFMRSGVIGPNGMSKDDYINEVKKVRG